jgi:hypothetical protein
MLVHFHNAHTHKYGADTQLFSIRRSTNCATCCVSIFIGSLKNLVPQQQQHSGRKILKRSTLPNPLQVFPGCPGCPPGSRFGAWLSPSSISGFFSDFLGCRQMVALMMFYCLNLYSPLVFLFLVLALKFRSLV